MKFVAKAVDKKFHIQREHHSKAMNVMACFTTNPKSTTYLTQIMFNDFEREVMPSWFMSPVRCLSQEKNFSRPRRENSQGRTTFSGGLRPALVLPAQHLHTELFFCDRGGFWLSQTAKLSPNLNCHLVISFVQDWEHFTAWSHKCRVRNPQLPVVTDFKPTQTGV